jgi:hypothetical protein
VHGIIAIAELRNCADEYLQLHLKSGKKKQRRVFEYRPAPQI